MHGLSVTNIKKIYIYIYCCWLTKIKTLCLDPSKFKEMLRIKLIEFEYSVCITEIWFTSESMRDER